MARPNNFRFVVYRLSLAPHGARYTGQGAIIGLSGLAHGGFRGDPPGSIHVVKLCAPRV